MNYRIKDIPKEERPRERLKEVGAESLTNKELLAIILKSGTKGKNVEELALEILNKFSLTELKEINITDLKKLSGIGEVKAIELVACIEFGKRIFLEKEESLKKLTVAINAVQYDKTILEQDEVNKMAADIESALAALEEVKAANPDTADINIVTLLVIMITGTFGLGYTIKKRFN